MGGSLFRWVAAAAAAAAAMRRDATRSVKRAYSFGDVNYI